MSEPTNSSQVDSRTPFVYWAQDRTRIFLRIEIRNPEEVNLKISEDGKSISFSSIGSSSQSRYQQHFLYTFSLPLSGTVMKNAEKVVVRDLSVEIVLNKAICQEKFWPSLYDHERSKSLDRITTSTTSSKNRNNSNTSPTPKWLKIDFARWTADPDDEEPIDDEEQKLANNAYMQQLMHQLDVDVTSSEKVAEQLKQALKTLELSTKGYLVLYNSGMWLAHLLMLTMLLSAYTIYGKGFFNTFWSNYHVPMMIMTLFQYIDVVNALTGVTRAGCLAALMQISGRVFMLLIIQANPEVQNWPPSFGLLIVYCVSEQFRYPYYALNSMNIDWPLLTRLRYSAWVLLYPLGFLTEGSILVASVPHFYTVGKWSLDLPNPLNMCFNFGALLALFMVTGFPLIVYTLFTHMLKQSRSKIGLSI